VRPLLPTILNERSLKFDASAGFSIYFFILDRKTLRIMSRGNHMQMKSILSGLTGLCLIFAQPGSVQAQSTAAAVASVAGSALSNFSSLPQAQFGQRPMNMTLGPIGSQVQQGMAMCQAKFAISATEQAATGSADSVIAGIVAAHSKTGTPTGSKTAASDSKDCATIYSGGTIPDQKTVCAMTCNGPAIAAKPSSKMCSYTDKTKDITNLSSLETQANAANSFELFLETKTTCDSDSFALFQKQTALYSCEMQAMQNGISLASNQLQATLGQNIKIYGNMATYQSEVITQVNGINGILGPDPELGSSGSAQFSGLLGIQKTLKDSLNKMNTESATMKSQVLTLQQGYTSNDQLLESNRVQVLSACLSLDRSTGADLSKSCYKPNAGSAAATAGATSVKPGYSLQPCTMTEWIQAQVRDSAYITKNGQVLVNSDGSQRSDQVSSEFSSLMQEIGQQFGNFDSTSKDASGAVTGRLVTQSTSWSDIETLYGAQMDQLGAETGVPVRSWLHTLGIKCTSDSNKWKNQQLTSASSDYNKTKTTLDSTKNTLTGQLTNDLSDLNGDYSLAYAAMTGTQSTLNRYSCTTDDPAKMSACMTTIMSGLQDTLEGNGVNSLNMSQSIPAGTLIPALPINCKGINGCVTYLQTAKKQAQQAVTSAGVVMRSFTTQADNAVNTQLMTLAGQLKQAQAPLEAQFGNINAALMGMKATPGQESANMIKGVSLLPSSGGKDKDGNDIPSGPYAFPTDQEGMGGVLSQFAGGLVDSKNSGMQSAMSAALEAVKDQQDAAKQQLSDYKDRTELFTDAEQACKDAVVSDLTACTSLASNSSGDGNDKTQEGASDMISPQIIDIARLIKNIKDSNISVTEEHKFNTDLDTIANSDALKKGGGVTNLFRSNFATCVANAKSDASLYTIGGHGSSDDAEVAVDPANSK
jgi:hypothetical protein